jgi:hypothetical protein
MLLMSHPEQLCVNLRFIKEYLLTFWGKCRAGVRIGRKYIRKTISGEVDFRPLLISAEEMISQFDMELPPRDDYGNHPARWRHTCWKLYQPRENIFWGVYAPERKKHSRGLRRSSCHCHD